MFKQKKQQPSITNILPGEKKKKKKYKFSFLIFFFPFAISFHLFQVCREFQRCTCTRQPNDCRYAHPPENVTVDPSDNMVTVCMDYMKGKCTRDTCKYFHPPHHLQAQIKAVQQRANAVAVPTRALVGWTLLAAGAAKILSLLFCPVACSSIPPPTDSPKPHSQQYNFLSECPFVLHLSLSFSLRPLSKIYRNAAAAPPPFLVAPCSRCECFDLLLLLLLPLPALFSSWGCKIFIIIVIYLLQTITRVNIILFYQYILIIDLFENCNQTTRTSTATTMSTTSTIIVITIIKALDGTIKMLVYQMLCSISYNWG